MKVIFLDIDGVLNVIPQGRDEYGPIFHKHFVLNLKYIIDQTNAKIVISSSWRGSGLDTMKEMWKKRNLPGDIVGITPFANEVVARGTCECYDDVSRGMEIQQWINDNKDNIESYCIIDDDSDMLEDQRNHFVKTSNNFNHPNHIDFGYGLTFKSAELAVKILNR